MSDIRLSPQHGVNPAIPLCFFCGEPKNEIVLPGRLPGDAEAPKNAVWDHRPCDTCAAVMRAGIILISVRDGEEGDNPYRTGGWVALKDEAFRRMPLRPPELVEDILRRRSAFVPDAAWDMLGLPRGPIEGVPRTPAEFEQQQKQQNQ